MNIVDIEKAIKTLGTILNDYQLDQVKNLVGQAIINYHENKAEVNYRSDLKIINVDMKLDVDTSDFEDVPF